MSVSPLDITRIWLGVSKEERHIWGAVANNAAGQVLLVASNELYAPVPWTPQSTIAIMKEAIALGVEYEIEDFPDGYARPSWLLEQDPFYEAAPAAPSSAVVGRFAIWMDSQFKPTAVPQNPVYVGSETIFTPDSISPFLGVPPQTVQYTLWRREGFLGSAAQKYPIYWSNEWETSASGTYQFSIDGIDGWHIAQADADRYSRLRYPDGSYSPPALLFAPTAEEILDYTTLFAFKNNLNSSMKRIEFATPFNLDMFSELRFRASCFVNWDAPPTQRYPIFDSPPFAPDMIVPLVNTTGDEASRVASIGTLRIELSHKSGLSVGQSRAGWVENYALNQGQGVLVNFERPEGNNADPRTVAVYQQVGRNHQGGGMYLELLGR